MDPRWPANFTRFGPFADLFRTGFPILTYHKFGPPPRKARLRGLHLSTVLLSSQLRDLRGAGYAFAGVEAFATRAPGTAVALTIDDGFESVHRQALPVLVGAGARATLYLVADRLGGWNDWETAQGEVAARLMEPAMVREWLAAGQGIGAHTLTHPWLTRIPLAQAREEVRASRDRLEDLFGVPVTDFCYPYGDWSPAIRDLVGEAGYRTAVTTDFGVNRADAPGLELRRITARHASRSLKSLRAWGRRVWARRFGRPGVQGPGPAPGSSPSASQRG